MPDSLNPLARYPLGIALIKQRNNLRSQNFIKIRAIHAVLFLHRFRVGILADRKTVGAVVPLSPPPVKNAEVQATVTTGFPLSRVNFTMFSNCWKMSGARL